VVTSMRGGEGGGKDNKEKPIQNQGKRKFTHQNDEKSPQGENSNQKKKKGQHTCILKNY